jgi:putative two-component system response regulator
MDEREILRKQTILVVDDTPDNLTLMNELLKDLYKVKVTNGGERALRIASADPQPDLILLDVMMPGMDGYEVCLRLKASPETRDIPVIFLTARNDPEDERRGLELGAVDYIAKPISPFILLARVKTHLYVKSTQDFLRDKNAFLEKVVARRTQEITTIQDVTILALTSLAETRDSETGNHIRRTQHYLKALAERLRDHPRFSEILTEPYIGILVKSAPLHDIGKVGIPDRILLKPGRLNEREFEVMKRHAMLGHNAIEHAEDQLGIDVKFLTVAKEVAHSHHEKYDGSGYPQGLVGEAIPVSARLMAVADVYDALIRCRPYKEALSHREAVEIIREGRGTHFDPDMTDAFLEIRDAFYRIAYYFADSERERKILAG